MQALNILDCPAEPHLLPILAKMENCLTDIPASIAWKPVLVLLKVTWDIMNVNDDDE